MFYYIRLFIMLVVFTVFLLILYKKQKKRLYKKNQIHVYSILGSIFIVALMITLTIPFEVKFLTFKTPEESFYYSHLHNNILKNIESKNGNFILYGEGCNIEGYTYILKSNYKWKAVSPHLELNNKIYENNQYKLNIGNYEKETLVLLTFDNQKENINNINITDNKDSDFNYYYCKYQKEMRYLKVYYKVLNDTNNYEIYENGTKLN